jgi:NADP-dependent 3-hydroxy acid dehydrogenase YdfG
VLSYASSKYNKQLTNSLTVGGTSGIGFSTAREFTRKAVAPHIYLIGRNESQASSIISELRSINDSATVDFVKSDVSLLNGVDAACQEISKKEEKVNLLFMTPGVLTLQGRTGMNPVDLLSMLQNQF